MISRISPVCFRGINPNYKRRISPEVQTDTVSFSGKKEGSSNLPSGLKFMFQKKEIEKAIKSNEEMSRSLENPHITGNNIDLADEIIFNEDIQKDSDFIKHANSVLFYTQDKEAAQIKKAMLTKLYSDERLRHGVPDFGSWASRAVNDTCSESELGAKSQMIDKVLSDERLYDDPFHAIQPCQIICLTRTQEQADAKCSLIDKILSDERLYNNESFMNEASSLIENTNKKEEAKVKSQIIDKILSEEMLSENSDFMNDWAASVVKCTGSKEDFETNSKILDEVLSNKEFYNGIGFINFEDAAALIEARETGEKLSKKLANLSD